MEVVEAAPKEEPKAVEEAPSKSRKHRSRSKSRDRRRSRSRDRRRRSRSHDRRRSRSKDRRRSRSNDRDRRRRSRSRSPRVREERAAPVSDRVDASRRGYNSGDWYGNSKRVRSSRDKSPSPARYGGATEESLLEEKRKREADEVTRDARTVFVSSLVVRATEQDVKAFFEAVGKVKDVQLIKDKSGKSKGFGYVEFAELDSVPPALVLSGRNFCMKHKGCTCSGLPVLVKPSEAEKNYEAAAQSSVAQLSARAYVGNLPGDAHQSELKEIFKAAGEVVDVIIPRTEKESYAFIQFKDQEVCQRAVHAFFGMKLRDHELKIGSLTSPNTVVAPNGETWEISAKGLSAQDRAAIISRLSGVTQAAAVDLGVTIAAGRGGNVKMPSVMGVVSGIPGLLGGTGPLGLVSRALVMKNMFDPAMEAEEGWEVEVHEDVKEECSKFGPVFFVSVDKLSAGHVYVFFSELSAAAAAGSAIAGRKFAGQVIEVEFIPESTFVAMFPSVNFASV